MNTKRVDPGLTQMATAEPNPEPLAHRAPEAARVLGISERQLWSLTASGQIPCVRVGRAKLYPVEALREWLRRKSRGGK